MRMVLVILLVGLSATSVCAEDFDQDFRGKQFDEKFLRVIGSRDVLFRESEGLRITMAKDKGDASNAGVAFPLQLAGDCSIEAAIELLDVPAPKGGYGTGVALLLEDGNANGASLQRVRMPKGEQCYVAHKFVVNAEGQYKHEAKTFPTGVSKAVIKIERHGSQLRYLVSEDGAESFRELIRYPFTAEPLRVAQVYAQVGGEPNDLSIRIDQFSVTGDAFLRPGQKPPKKPLPIQWVVAGLFVGMPLAGAGLWWYRRRQRTA